MDRLSKVSVREVIRTAKDRHAGTQGYAEAMLLQYNKRLKYPLRWNSLHQGASASTEVGDSTEDMQISMGTGFLTDTSRATAVSDDDTDDDEFDDEEIPDHADALPNQTLMDNLHLSGSN